MPHAYGHGRTSHEHHPRPGTILVQIEFKSSVHLELGRSRQRAQSTPRDYLDRVREGDERVITDRGVPIARLLGLTATLERLAADGVIARAAAAPRPKAAGQPRPRPRRPLADQVSDQRR
jgi:prevent-host-death family protein